MAPASVWVLRGERAGARDGALAWVADRVREGGGLAGARPVRLPVRPAEWAVLALLLGVGAGALWPRRLAAVALAGLALAAAGVTPAEDLWTEHVGQAVVARAVGMEGSEFQLEPGQVVQVLERRGATVRVRIGNELVGRMPAEVLLPVTEAR